MFPVTLARTALLLGLAVVMAVKPAWADEADDQYAVAAGLFARQEWKLAADEFQQFVEKYPNHAKSNQAMFFLGETLLQLGRYEQAQARFLEYLRREPEGRYARTASFHVAEAAYFLNQFDRAKADLEQLASKYPSDPLNAHILAYLGDIALAQNDPQRAEKYFRQCLERYPQGPRQDECRFGLARALERQNMLEEAANYYLGLGGKTASPLAAESQFRLGAIQYSRGDYAAAVRTLEAFESTFVTSSWQSAARLKRSWALVKLNRPAEARAILEKIRSDPKLGMEARYWLGLAWKMEKDWAAAAKTLLEAAAADPKHPLVPAMRFHAGDALLRAEQYAAAREQFDLVVASQAEAEWVEQALRGRIQVALRTKDYAAVDRDASDFLQRFANSSLAPDVRAMLGSSLVERKQYQRAAEILAPLVAGASKEAPRLEERYFLVLAYEGMERWAEALKALEPVLASATGELKADALLVQASLLMALKRHGEAIVPLEGFLATQPTGDREFKGLGQLAICHARVGQLEKAKARFAELIQKYPHHELMVPTTEQLADAVYDAGDSDWSSRLFAWLSASGRSSDRQTRGLLGLGWSQYKAGRLQEAADTFEQVLKRNPSPALAAEAALVRGRTLQKLNQPDAALAMYGLIIQRYPTSAEMPDALWAAAQLHNSQKRYKEAAALYERLAKEFPQFAEADAVLYKWGWAMADLGQKDQSSKLFDRLRAEKPQSSLWPHAVFHLAQRAFEAKEYSRADELLASLLARTGTNPEIQLNALQLNAEVAFAQEKWDDARQILERLLKQFPQAEVRPQAELRIGETFLRQGNYPEAQQRFARLTAQTQWPDKSWPALVRLRLAQTLAHQQKWKEAYAVAAKIEQEFPGFEEQYEVDYLLGRCLAMQADFEAAREAYRRVVRSKHGAKTETAAKAQLMIAESFFHQRNYEAALREYLRVEILYAFPMEQAAAAMQAAKCHELLGEWKEAAEVYIRLIKSYPDTTFAKEARQRLRDAQQRAGESRGEGAPSGDTNNRRTQS